MLILKCKKWISIVGTFEIRCPFRTSVFIVETAAENANLFVLTGWMGVKASTGLVDLWVDSGPVLQEKAFHTVRWFESEISLEMCSRQKHYTIQSNDSDPSLYYFLILTIIIIF